MTEILNTYPPQRSESVTRGFRLVTFATRLALTIRSMIIVCWMVACSSENAFPGSPPPGQTVRASPPQNPPIHTRRVYLEARERGSEKTLTHLFVTDLLDEAYRLDRGVFVADIECGSGRAETVGFFLRGYATEIVERSAVLAHDTLDDPMQIRLTPVEVLRGRVVDSEGLPVADADVVEMQCADNVPLRRSRWCGVRTDSEGWFAIDAPRDREFELLAIGDGFVSATTKPLLWITGRPPPEITIRLPRGVDRAGVVLDEEGKPVVGAEVRAGGTYESFDPHVLTDEEGRFVLRNTPEKCVVGVFAPGFRDFPFSVSGERHLELRLLRLATLRGVVVDRDGDPVAGVAVHARFHPFVCLSGVIANNLIAGTIERYRGAHSITGPDGSFELVSEPDGSVELTVEKVEGDARPIRPSVHSLPAADERGVLRIELRESLP